MVSLKKYSTLQLTIYKALVHLHTEHASNVKGDLHKTHWDRVLQKALQAPLLFNVLLYLFNSVAMLHFSIFTIIFILTVLKHLLPACCQPSPWTHQTKISTLAQFNIVQIPYKRLKHYSYPVIPLAGKTPEQFSSAYFSNLLFLQI